MSYKLNAAQPIVDANGTMEQPFRQFTQEASLSIPIRGAGSPEGGVEGYSVVYIATPLEVREQSNTERCSPRSAVTVPVAG